jgi:hypothetical protein
MVRFEVSMSRRLVLSLAAFVIAFQLGGAMVQAQGSKQVVAEIGFPFVAGDKTLPAGKYVFEVTDAGPVMLTGPGGVRAVLPVITRLGRHDQDPDSEFVFDKLDGKSVLSEIWLPKKDGFLLLASKAPHEHAVLGGSNPRK